MHVTLNDLSNEQTNQWREPDNGVTVYYWTVHDYAIHVP